MIAVVTILGESIFTATLGLFYQLVKLRRIPEVDLFAYYLNHQFPVYILGNQIHRVDPLQQYWENLFGYAFPRFYIIGKIFSRARQEENQLLVITPACRRKPRHFSEQGRFRGIRQLR